MKIPPPCDETMGFRLVSKGEAATTWEWTPDARFENPAGLIQGGLVGAFLDTVCGATVVRALAGRKAIPVTVEQKTTFLRSVRSGTTLTGVGRTRRLGKQLAFVEAEATDPAGQTVAMCSATWMLRPRE